MQSFVDLRERKPTGRKQGEVMMEVRASYSVPVPFHILVHYTMRVHHSDEIEICSRAFGSVLYS